MTLYLATIDWEKFDWAPVVFAIPAALIGYVLYIAIKKFWSMK